MGKATMVLVTSPSGQMAVSAEVSSLLIGAFSWQHMVQTSCNWRVWRRSRG